LVSSCDLKISILIAAPPSVFCFLKLMFVCPPHLRCGHRMGWPKQCLSSNIKTPDFSFMVQYDSTWYPGGTCHIVVFPALSVSCSCLRSVMGGMIPSCPPRGFISYPRITRCQSPVVLINIVHDLSSQGSNLISAAGGCSAPPPRRHFIWNSRYSSFGDLTLDKLGREQKAGCNYTPHIWQ
jgi:hypothetical protein